jgi:hypothetical protein
MCADERKKQQPGLHPVSYLAHKKRGQNHYPSAALTYEDQHPQFLLALEGVVVRLRLDTEKKANVTHHMVLFEFTNQTPDTGQCEPN